MAKITIQSGNRNQITSSSIENNLNIEVDNAESEN